MITVFVVPAATNIATGSPPSEWKFYHWLSAVIAVALTVLTAVIELHRRRSAGGRHQDSTPEQLNRAEAYLTDKVKAQWRQEAIARDLLTSPALMVHWTPAAIDISGIVVHPGESTCQEWAHSDKRIIKQPRDIYEVFQRLPAERLAILGSPGAGKTSLAVLLTLGLLEHHRPGEPIPVLLSFATWDPQEHVHSWMARRLMEDYPGFANSDAYGNTAARRLVTSGRVLPVLDGLDELPERVRAHAVSALNRQLATSDPLVITCRTREYEQAVKGAVLRAAVAIEIEPLTPDNVIAFLQPSYRSERWQPIFNQLRVDRDGPLACALSTPLMSSLVRIIYSAEHADPATLADPIRFATRDAIENHLLFEYIQTAFTEPEPPVRPGSASRHWDPDRARRWFTFLATHLNNLDTYDLAWWELTPPRWVAGLVTGLICGLMGGFISGLVGGLVGGLAAGLWYTLAGGLLAVLSNPGRPSGVDLRLRGRTTQTIQSGATGLTIGMVVGLTGQIAFGLAVGLTTDTMIVNGFLVGFLFGLTFGLTSWLSSPADTERAVSVNVLLHRDRTVAILRGFMIGIGVGIAGSLAAGLIFGLAAALAGGLAAGLVGGLSFGLMRTAWAHFLIARTWCAMGGDLPWRLMTFLRDTHRLGVLREVGAVYQFRHARLQEHLAQKSSPSSTEQSSR